MFNSKQTSLLGDKMTSAKTTTNAFLNAAGKKSAKTFSGNGALKYSTTGNDFVDQFGKLGTYKVPRSYDEISTDASTLWEKNAFMSVQFIFFLRIITRVVSFFDGSKTKTVQRGAGLKHEAITRMVWLSVNHTDTFWKNIILFISVGSWNDVIQMLSYDLQYNGWNGRKLDWNKMGQLILAGLENPNNNNLLKKYLPQIKANSVCHTLEAQADNVIAKWICGLMFGTGEERKLAHYRLYRRLKTSGTAHEWQKLISKKKFAEINFDTVHGRALVQLVSSKFLKNQGLEDKYQEWISSKPIAKFTGYVHELFKKIPTEKYQIDTLNAQFMGAVETAKKDAVTSTGLIVVRDTSGSMKSEASGAKMSCFNIGKALALFFSYMLPDGHFSKHWIEFNSDAKLYEWKGSTPYERWCNDHSDYIGSTNFQSVINLLCSIKHSNVSESEFPSGILCISDSEFDPVQLDKTNVESAYARLRSAGFSEEYISNFKIILWNLQSSFYGRTTGQKFETYGGAKNVFYFSGYEASTVAFLTGVNKVEKAPTTAGELFAAAMTQEVLAMVQL